MEKKIKKRNYVFVLDFEIGFVYRYDVERHAKNKKAMLSMASL